ncbi:unnamed protein product [Sympodiomycopsis kandeliae]
MTASSTSSYQVGDCMPLEVLARLKKEMIHQVERDGKSLFQFIVKDVPGAHRPKFQGVPLFLDAHTGSFLNDFMDPQPKSSKRKTLSDLTGSQTQQKRKFEMLAIQGAKILERALPKKKSSQTKPLKS